MLLLFVSYNWQERSLKRSLWKGLSGSDYFIASPCHFCVFWYMLLLLNSSACSEVINAPVFVFLRLTYSVQSLVKSVADIVHFPTPKSNEKLFYSQTYLLTAYFIKRKIFKRLTCSIRKSTETTVKIHIFSLRIIFQWSFISKEFFK